MFSKEIINSKDIDFEIWRKEKKREKVVLSLSLFDSCVFNSPSSLDRKSLALSCELCIIIRPLLAGDRAHFFSWENQFKEIFITLINQSIRIFLSIIFSSISQTKFISLSLSLFRRYEENVNDHLIFFSLRVLFFFKHTLDFSFE